MTTVADEKIAKLTRFLHGVEERALKNSLNVDDFVLVNQHLLGKGSRSINLVEYARHNCPKVDYTKPTPKARLGKSKSTLFDEPSFYKTQKRFAVDSDLERYVGLQIRSTRKADMLKRRPLTENESEATMFGKIDSDKHKETLHKVVDLGQIAEKVQVQRNGEEGELLTNGYANIFPVRGASGALFVVYVIRYDGRWHLYCSPFNPVIVWDAGNQVFSN